MDLKPAEIKLRRKYRVVVNGTQKSSGAGSPGAKKTKHQLSPAELAAHAAQPKKTMVVKANGKKVMISE